MSSYSTSQTFTRTHAKYLASKVVADLYQCAKLYSSPSVDEIADYEAELIEMLVGGYVLKYEFGFKKDGKRVVTWEYTVNSAGDLIGGATDDGAGGVYARAKVAQASYFNFMTYSSKWSALTQSARTSVVSTLPFARSEGSAPDDGDGYWVNDRTYSNGGTSVGRRTFRPS